MCMGIIRDEERMSQADNSDHILRKKQLIVYREKKRKK